MPTDDWNGSSPPLSLPRGSPGRRRQRRPSKQPLATQSIMAIDHGGLSAAGRPWAKVPGKRARRGATAPRAAAHCGLACGFCGGAGHTRFLNLRAHLSGCSFGAGVVVPREDGRSISCFPFEGQKNVVRILAPSGYIRSCNGRIFGAFEGACCGQAKPR